MWFASLCLLLNADAYDLKPWGDRASGNQVVFTLDPDTLNSTQRATLIAAAAAWDSGSGQLLRGADWTTTLVTLPPGTSTGLNNGRNEIYMRDNDWFDDHDEDWTPAFHHHGLDRDIVFNSDYNWCNTDAPSENPSCRSGLTLSLGQAMVHEVGHLWLDHEDDLVATMNSQYPAGGDVGEAKWRIHEDDFAGLLSIKSDNSTGFNVLVGEYRYGGGSSAVILWEGSKTWDKSNGAWVGGAPPPPRFLYNGTGSASVPVEWRLSRNPLCSSIDYLIGTRTPNMSTNAPYAVNPNSWSFPSNIPVGRYYYCVRVDPNNTLNETTRADNKVVSRGAYVRVRN